MIKGWTVRVTMLRPGGGSPIVSTYDVAIADAKAAIAAAREASGSDQGAIVETIAPLPSTALLCAGDVALHKAGIG